MIDLLLSSAIEKYVSLFGVACNYEKNVLFTNNDSAYETAINLYQKGINIETIQMIIEKKLIQN